MDQLTNTLDGFIQRIAEIIVQPALTLLFVVALLYFAWGVFQMIVNSRDGRSEKFANGKKAMVWGFVGMVLMLVASGIIQTMCVWLKVACG